MVREEDSERPAFILLFRESQNHWRAEITKLKPSWRSSHGTLETVVAEARQQLSSDVAAGISLKVYPRTQLGAEEVLSLIEQNGGASRLHLDSCYLTGVDLTPDAISARRTSYYAQNGKPPPWISEETGGVDLRGIHLSHADLLDSRLQRADMKLAVLEAAHLHGVDLRYSALCWARLQGANLMDADLTGANLEAANLEDVDLSKARSLDGASWLGILLNRTRMRRDQLGAALGDELLALHDRSARRYLEASEAYLAIKNNLNQLGRYEDASWAHVKEKQMRKMADHWVWRQHDWRFWRRRERIDDEVGDFSEELIIVPFLRWLRSWAYELLAGYGERPSNPIVGGAFVIIGFGLGFWFTRAVANLIDAMTYSMATFATFNLSRQELNPEGVGAEVASSAEALLGIGILALFVFTLGNRMSRG